MCSGWPDVHENWREIKEKILMEPIKVVKNLIRSTYIRIPQKLVRERIINMNIAVTKSNFCTCIAKTKIT